MPIEIYLQNRSKKVSETNKDGLGLYFIFHNHPKYVALNEDKLKVGYEYDQELQKYSEYFCKKLPKDTDIKSVVENYVAEKGFDYIYIPLDVINKMYDESLKIIEDKEDYYRVANNYFKLKESDEDYAIKRKTVYEKFDHKYIFEKFYYNSFDSKSEYIDKNKFNEW